MGLKIRETLRTASLDQKFTDSYTQEVNGCLLFCQALEFENDRLKDVRHNLESDVASRDRIINELRLHMPAITSSSKMYPMIKVRSKLDDASV